MHIQSKITIYSEVNMHIYFGRFSIKGLVSFLSLISLYILIWSFKPISVSEVSYPRTSILNCRTVLSKFGLMVCHPLCGILFLVTLYKTQVSVRWFTLFLIWGAQLYLRLYERNPISSNPIYSVWAAILNKGALLRRSYVISN